MNQQDFTPLILKKVLTKEQKIKKGKYVAVKKVNAGGNKAANQSDVSAKKLDQEELPQVPKVSRALATAITNARVAKKLTRKDLGNLCSMTEADITAYETCKAIPQAAQLRTMSKHLGVVLKKNMEE